jgi:hypothetical protein
MNRWATSLLAGMAIAASPTLAAEVTEERLINADREPLSRINRDNVKNLRLAFAVPLGGELGNGAIEATPPPRKVSSILPIRRATLQD